MRALALQSNEAATPLKKFGPKAHRIPVSPLFPQAVSVNSNIIQRKAGCACGGGCPSCEEKASAGSIQAKLQISSPGDQYEQEADAVAEQVMRMPEPGHARVAGIRKSDGLALARRASPALSHAPDAPPNVREVLTSAGHPLEGATRSWMESRFGFDFSPVRVHADQRAAESASGVKARAYTVGDHIVFGAGEYAPSSSAGQQLIAHELAHVVQQTGAAGRAPQGVVQRKPTISILDENFVGPPSATQRRAERSCPIDCCQNRLGTLHAMPLFHSASRTAVVPAGSPLATGIGASLHFIRSSIRPSRGDVCRCDDLRMIQIVTSNDPEDPRGNNSFVDNANIGTSPFYGSVGLTGRNEHTIDPRFVDAGERIRTSESIYDIPFRTDAMLAASGLTSDFSWMAETCVACIKNSAPDRLLGCVTYGFTRPFDPVTNTFGAIVDVSPQCQDSASANFVSTLTTDPTTTTYDFEEAPDAIDCGERGDFNPPTGDTRMA